MNIYKYLAIGIVTSVLAACGYNKIDTNLLMDSTNLQPIRLPWIIENKSNKGIAAKNLEWPIISPELNILFDNTKQQLNLKGQLTMAELLSKFEVKENVKLKGLDLKMYPVLSKALTVWQKYGKNIVITSALEGKHCKNSRHYAGLALDLRSRDIEKKYRVNIMQDLSNALGDDFLVLLEHDHFHVEFDPVATDNYTNQFLVSQRNSYN